MGGAEMAAIRRELGLTQSQVGEALGISKQRVSALEREAVEMSLPMAVAVCAALSRLSGGRREVTLDELAGVPPRGVAGALPERVRRPMEALTAALVAEVGHGGQA